MNKLGIRILAASIGLFALAASSTAADSTTSIPGSEEYIIREVRHELITLPYYNVFDNLDYTVHGGVVTLLGQVTWPALKSDAENVVKPIAGVVKVVNDIKVLPLSPMDHRIRLAVFRSIYGWNSPLFRYREGAIPQIHIIVDNGHVTLIGSVDNKQDREIAGMRASQVPGVFSVKNELQVNVS